MRTRLASLLRRWAERLDPAPSWPIQGSIFIDGKWSDSSGFVWGDYSASGNGAWKR